MPQDKLRISILLSIGLHRVDLLRYQVPNHGMNYRKIGKNLSMDKLSRKKLKKYIISIISLKVDS